MQQFIFSKTLKLTESQKRSIDFIHKTFRNKFEHFIPTRWSIETSGMPEIVSEVLNVIEFWLLNRAILRFGYRLKASESKMLCN